MLHINQAFLFIFLIAVLISVNISVNAQETDSLNNSYNIGLDENRTSSSVLALSDSLNTDAALVENKVRFKLIKSILDKQYPNPNRAAAMSFILPGSGQVYNKKAWKLPIVYGALGGLGYMIYFNNDRYQTFRVAYSNVVDGDPSTVNEFPFTELSETGLLRSRDRFNKRRQQGYIFFVLAWVLNSVDAYVDAHLASFDVNEDISMHLSPTGIHLGQSAGYGLSVRFTHQEAKVAQYQFQY